MSIDLLEHAGFVYKRLHSAGFPEETKEDAFQDFALFFYENYKPNDEYKPTTILRTLMHSWLTKRAFKYSQKKTVPEKAYEWDGRHNPDWLEYNSKPIEEHPDILKMCEEVWGMISEDLKAYLLYTAQGDTPSPYNSTEGNPLSSIMEREGVSRQAVQKRLKIELEALRNTLER